MLLLACPETDADETQSVRWTQHRFTSIAPRASETSGGCRTHLSNSEGPSRATSAAPNSFLRLVWACTSRKSSLDIRSAAASLSVEANRSCHGSDRTIFFESSARQCVVQFPFFFLVLPVCIVFIDKHSPGVLADSASSHLISARQWWK